MPFGIELRKVLFRFGQFKDRVSVRRDNHRIKRRFPSGTRLAVLSGKSTMAANENATVKKPIDRIRHLSGDDQGSREFFEAASLAQTLLHDTVGGSHPLMGAIQVPSSQPIGTGPWA